MALAVAAMAAPACSERDARSAEPAAEELETSTVAGDLVSSGMSAYFAADYDSARVLLSRALTEAGAGDDSSTYADALTWLGLTSWKQGRFAESRAFGESALHLKERRDFRHDASRSYNALGLLALTEGRLDDALSLFDRSIEAAQAVGDEVAVGRGLNNRSLVLFERGEFAEARRGYESLRALAAAAGEARAEAIALANLAMHDVRLGYASSAIPQLERARALYALEQHVAGEENALGQLGSAYERMGDYNRAIAYLDSAVRLARRHDMVQAQVENLLLLADLFGRIGDNRRALELLVQARALALELDLVVELGDIARAEAEVYAELGQFDVARERMAEALRRHRTAGSRYREFLDLIAAAHLAQSSARLREADALLAEADALSGSLDAALPRAWVALARADILEQRGDARAALRTLNAASESLERLDRGVGWLHHAVAARAHDRIGNLDAAAAAGRSAVAALELVRSNLPSIPLRTSHTESRAAIYGHLVHVLLRLGHTDEAFQVAEAARSRPLIEHLAAAGRVRPSGTAEQLAESERLLRHIDALVELLQQADTIPERERSSREVAHMKALNQRLASARREYELVLERAVSLDPSGALLLGTIPASASTIREALGAGEVMLQFFVAPERLITFVVRRDTVHAFQVAVPAAHLGTRARLAHDIGASRVSPAHATMPLLRSLHELLIGPALDAGLLEGARTLIVVPQASLIHVPFAALVDSAGRYLVERFALVTLPTAAALGAGSLREDVRADRSHVFAPFPERLPGSAVEAIAVSRKLRGARRHLGASASERSLRQALQRRGIVHVASHGMLDETSPLFSRIELAAPARRSPADDGRLEVHELLSLDVRSDLVFLSGCETGAVWGWSTPFRRGQDYSSLAQAFLYAGAASVIATLWRIDDEGAARFAEYFYEELDGAGPGAALASAQRRMILDDEYAAPRYWAGYTISQAGVRSAETIAGRASVPSSHRTVFTSLVRHGR